MSWYKTGTDVGGGDTPTPTPTPVEIVTWANGTDEQIVAMVEAHYRGDIDITTIWSVGDERTVTLSAMDAMSPLTDTYAQQSVTFVLMNKGGKYLFDGTTECAFIVGQKNTLIYNSNAYMNSTNSNTNGWDGAGSSLGQRRRWCNTVYYNAIPSTLRSIFKQYGNYTSLGNGGHSTAKLSIDLFALPSEKEILGSTSRANSTAEANNKQFKYYETSANRIKYNGNTSTKQMWWTRSPANNSNTHFVGIMTSGSSSIYGATSSAGIAPFGVI